MDPALFLADLERKPEQLRSLAAALDDADPWAALPGASRLVLLGMGSSAYAASVAAARLRAAGVDAVAELAGTDLLPPADEPLSSLSPHPAASSAAAPKAQTTVRHRADDPIIGSPPVVWPLCLRETCARSAAGPEQGWNRS